jgi:hypothetical protein
MERSETLCVNLGNICNIENHGGPISLSIKCEESAERFIFFYLKKEAVKHK